MRGFPATEETVDQLRVLHEAPLNLQASDHGPAAVGDNVTDDSDAILAKLAALPTPGGALSKGGGEIFAPPPPGGAYRLTKAIPMESGKAIVGAGGILGPTEKTAPTMFRAEFDGPVFTIPVFAMGYALRDLAVIGDLTKTNQDLVVIGEPAQFVSQGSLCRVSLVEAGRTNLVLENTINSHFLEVRCERAAQYNLHARGAVNGVNACKFSKCLFRQAQQWGIKWERGSGSVMDCCTIESNSLHPSIAFGGLHAAGVNNTVLVLLGCYWENNQGFDGTAPPLRMDQIASVCQVIELGSQYVAPSNNCPVILNGGRLASFGIETVITPHAILDPAMGSAEFFGAIDSTAPFSLTDTGAKARIYGGNNANAITLGDVALLRSAADTLRILDQVDIQRAAGTDPGLTHRIPADTNARFATNINGTLTWGPGNTTADLVLSRTAADQLLLATDDALLLGSATGSGKSFLQFLEQSADPTAPAVNGARLFTKDNGAGKTQLCVRFNTGAVQVIATEP